MSYYNKPETLLTQSLSFLNALVEECTNTNFYQRLLETLVPILALAEAASIMVFDEKMQKLRVEATIGLEEVHYRKILLDPGKAVTGKAYETQQFQVVNGQEKVRDIVETMTFQNQQYYQESLPNGVLPHAVSSFPLLFQKKVIAVLTVSRFQQDAYFDQKTLQLFEKIIPYLSLMLAHFILIKKEKVVKKELAITHKALRKEHTQLQRTTDLYNDLASLISQNQSVEEMMRAIYTSTQTPIAFYDELLFPIASFGGSQETQLPANFLSLKEVQYVISLKKWQLISREKDSLLVIPVIGAETVIGFLCAWIEEEKFNDGNRLLLEYSASMLGLELIKKRSIEETRRQATGDILEQLIIGDFNENVIRQARNLHLNETDYYTILICEDQRAMDSFNQYIVKDSWIKWIQKTMEASGIDGLVTQRGLDVIAFLTMDGDKNQHTVRGIGKTFAENLETIPFDVKIGIGRMYKGFINVRKSYIDALQSLEMLKKKKNGKVLHFANTGFYRLLLDYDKDELNLYVHDHLGPLLEFRSKKEKELLQTLLDYVSYDRDLTKTTNKLLIHHNTLYYRIRRIEEILHISFSNHDDWFDISLACKIYLFLNE